jgi:aminocarboxymuconate-semialdehyde decarboxylase
MLAIGSVGASQLLFGTDDPFIGSDSRHVDRLPISPADKAAILGGNAGKMLGLK